MLIPIIERMHAELVRILAQSAVRDKLTAQGMDIVASEPGVFARFVVAEMERWGKVVRDNKIKAGE